MDGAICDGTGDHRDAVGRCAWMRFELLESEGTHGGARSGCRPGIRPGRLLDVPVMDVGGNDRDQSGPTDLLADPEPGGEDPGAGDTLPIDGPSKGLGEPPVDLAFNSVPDLEDPAGEDPGYDPGADLGTDPGTDSGPVHRECVIDSGGCSPLPGVSMDARSPMAVARPGGGAGLPAPCRRM